MKKEFELNNAKILYPPMIVHKDRNGENIIQPIPLCEKTNRHIKCSVKEINKKEETVYKDKKFIELWLDDPKIHEGTENINYDSCTLTYILNPDSSICK